MEIRNYLDYESNYNKNIDNLLKINPEITEKLIQEDISDFEIIEDNGKLKNIKYCNDFLYPDEPILMSKIQVEEFITNPQYIAQVPVGEAGSKDIHDMFSKKILKYSPLKNGKGYLFQNYKTSSKNFPLLILSGIGAGYSILHLIHSININHLIIAEKDLKFLKLSFHLFDWTNIFEYFSRNGYSLSFLVNENSTILSNDILATISNINPMYATFFYNFGHLRSKYYAEVLTKVKNNLELLFKGWGFYDDEVISLKNTLSNISNNYPLLTSINDIEFKDIPVFIIASGPSLDDDIEFLKNNKNNALILSCGTALKVLYKNNIKPDFHLEIERPESTFDALNEAAPKEFLKDIDLIALNVLNPKVLSLFKQAYIYFRDIDTGSSTLTQNIYKFLITNPTVTNAAVSLSLILRFRNIYLFGTDMGFKSMEKHHSKHTVYNTENSKYFTNKMKGHKKIPGNFCKEVYTTEIFFWTKFMIERSIAGYKTEETNVYNCSDGAKIEGTISIKSKDILLSKIEEKDKQDNIKKYFRHVEMEKLLSEGSISEITKKLNADIEFLIKVINEFYPRIDESNYLVFLDLLYIYLKSMSQTSKSLIGSSIKSYFYYIYSHTASSSDIKLKRKFISNGIIEIRKYLEFIQKDITDILSCIK